MIKKDESMTTEQDMQDPWNPTVEDIRSWAKNKKFAPVQDWDLALYPKGRRSALRASIHSIDTAIVRTKRGKKE